MLIKEVCQKCNKEYGYDWTVSDEDYWKVNKLWCVVQTIPQLSDTNEIPKGCRYSLEHMVMNQDATK